jgi:ectoine hydroxylase-related dioxygenase (phytanoyl-CoA dioxygenase family)
MHMTDQQRIDFEARGYLVININNDALAQLQTAFDQSRDHLDDLPNQDDAFISLAEHPNIFPIAHTIISDEIQLRSLTGFIRPPDSAGRGWHQEVAGLLGVHHALSTLCIQVFIHLDDAPKNGACLMAVPGSHRFKSYLPMPDITHIQDMPHAVKLPAQAGTVTILHGNLYQAHTRNQSNTSQRFLNLTYVQCWMRHALPKLSPHTVERIRESVNLCQLFAVRDLSSAPGYWSGQLENYPEATGLPNRQFSPLKVVGKGTEPNR